TLSVTDVDSLGLVGATVSVASGAFAGDGDVLAASTGGTSITASYNAASETLTLTGSDTLADYQQVLDSVTFNSTSENPDDFGSAPTRQVTWVLNDGAGSFNTSAAQTTTVSVTAVNDAPTLTNVAAAVSAIPAVVTTLSPSVTVTDPDNQKLVSATVSISGGTFANDGDVLGFDTSGTSITASYDATNEVLTLSGSDTLAHYRQVLDTVTFDATGADPVNGGANPTRTISWVANDGAGSFNLSAAQLTTVTIVQGPAIVPAASASYTEQGASTTLSPSVFLTPSGATTLTTDPRALTGGKRAGAGAERAAATRCSPATL